MKRGFLLSAFVCAIQFGLLAVPASPKPAVFTQPDGTQIILTMHGDEFYHYLTNEQGEVVEKDADGFYRPTERLSHRELLQRRSAAKQLREVAAGQKRVGGYTPAPRGIVVIVEFSDFSCIPATTQESMNEMCNGDNYTYGGAYGSARKYFLDQSNNTYAPVFDVYGPIRLSRTRSYYGQNDEYGFDAHPEEAVAEACIIAHDSLGADFSLYDSDNNGEIDFVYMIHAGNGENITGQPSYLIWPHQGYAWNTQTFLDGKRLNKYACSAELENNSTTQRCGIGTLCHEFSHVLGQPDYYDTEYGTNYSEALIPGDWDIMSSGSYNDDSRRPANYSVFEKYQFGWITPTNLNRTQDVTMEASKDYFYTSPDGNNKPYNTPDTVYYFENRQKTGWDQGLPGHGMLIWRVVYDENAWSSNEPNNEPYKPRCMFIPADGTYLYGGDSGDPFPGTRRVTEFQVPNTIYSISQIFETAGKIQFHFVAGCDGYIADITASHVHITTPQESVCYPANQPFSMTVLPAKNYQLTDTSFTVIMGGTPLVEGVGYTFQNNVFTIPALTGDLMVEIKAEKIPFDYDHCMYFFWQPNEPVQGNALLVDDVNWTLNVTGSTYRGFDTSGKDRGAQFGSRSTAPQYVQFLTNDMSNCLITQVCIVASQAEGGSGYVAVVLDDEWLGSEWLKEEPTEFRFNNPEEYHGTLDIGFCDLNKALFIKKIFIHFAEETENPDGLEQVKAAQPQGPVIGIYSVTGQYLGVHLETLDRGLYLVHHTDGTEKVLVQ